MRHQWQRDQSHHGGVANRLWEVLQSIKSRLVMLCPGQPPNKVNALMWYHALLLRTGGGNQWTLKRECGETLVKPYHPLLLEALQQEVVVRVVVETEHLEPERNLDLDEPHERIMAGFAWKEISVLKFLHGISKYEEPVSQATVAVIITHEEELNFNESSEKDEECDEIFINNKNESYVITNGDLRKLYALRPDVEGVKDMTFGQFIIDYYKKQARQQAIVDPSSGVGDESEEPIVGGEVRAPSAMKLFNTVREAPLKFMLGAFGHCPNGFCTPRPALKRALWGTLSPKKVPQTIRARV